MSQDSKPQQSAVAMQVSIQFFTSKDRTLTDKSKYENVTKLHQPTVIACQPLVHTLTSANIGSAMYALKKEFNQLLQELENEFVKQFPLDTKFHS